MRMLDRHKANRIRKARIQFTSVKVSTQGSEIRKYLLNVETDFDILCH